MTTRKRNSKWAVVSMLVSAGGAAYLMLMGACAPPEGGDPVAGASACAQVDDSGNEYETTAGVTSGQGRALSYTRRVITAPDEDDSSRVETDVTVDGEPLLTIVSTNDGMGGAEVQIAYGALVPGLESANIVIEAGMINGTINGRAIVSMAVENADPAATSFEDGDPPPDPGVDADLEAALTALFAAADEAAEDCEPALNDAAKVASLDRRLRIPPQDTGHGSNPKGSAGCIGCWAGCSTATAGCIAGVSAGCVASLWFYAVCEGIGVAACAVAYVGCVAACNADGAPCCPEACGAVACCADGETCLNSSIGLCCDSGKTPCVGESCCSSTQTCISTGPNAGVCCEPEDICGNTCCESTESCIAEVSLCCPADEVTCDDHCCGPGEICLGDGLCCDPENACGDACCDGLDSCIESLSLCCGFDNPPCNDECCDVGEDCLNGTTCCPEGRVCGSICCPEGHSCDDPQTNQCAACPNPTDNPCVVGGCCEAGKLCQDVEGFCCNPGMMCCDVTCSGGCEPISACID